MLTDLFADMLIKKEPMLLALALLGLIYLSALVFGLSMNNRPAAKSQELAAELGRRVTLRVT